VSIIDKTLKDDARKYFDIESFLQFNNTACRFAPASGNSATAITLDTGGTCSTTNALALNTGHIKAIGDTMKERNVAPYIMDDYVSISHPSTYRAFKNSLETLHQYTETGLAHIFNGEIGRYESFRFIEQTFIPKGGAANATTYDPWSGTAQAWASGLSSWAFMMGGDTVTEAICVPEEIRAKLPGDFGRSRGIAWYYLGGSFRSFIVSPIALMCPVLSARALVVEQVPPVSSVIAVALLPLAGANRQAVLLN
jgi:hypothetical protein